MVVLSLSNALAFRLLELELLFLVSVSLTILEKFTLFWTEPSNDNIQKLKQIHKLVRFTQITLIFYIIGIFSVTQHFLYYYSTQMEFESDFFLNQYKCCWLRLFLKDTDKSEQKIFFSSSVKRSQQDCRNASVWTTQMEWRNCHCLPLKNKKSTRRCKYFV